MNSDSGNNFLQLLNPDNTMSFNRLLAHAIGANETIIYFCLISKMMYYESRDRLQDDGFFYATALDIQESTTFTHRQQAPIIKKLVNIGLIETKLQGLPAKKYYRIIYNQELILSLIEQGRIISDSIRKQKKTEGISTVQTSIDKMLKQGQTLENSQFEQNVETCNDVTLKQDLTKCKTKDQQNVETCNDKMSKQVTTKCQNRFEQNVETSIDKMSNKSKYNNLNIIKLNSNNLSINQSIKDKDMMDRIDRCKEQIKQNIDYDILILPEYKIDQQQLDGIVDLLTYYAAINTAPVKIGQNLVPAEEVKARFSKITGSEITYVFEALQDTTSKIKNIRAYLLTCLYNANATKDVYWSNRVQHDMAEWAEQSKNEEVK